MLIFILLLTGKMESAGESGRKSGREIEANIAVWTSEQRH